MGQASGVSFHIWDLAAAHLAALGRFDALPAPALAINLGTGQGTTVRELLDAFNRTVEYPVRALRRPVGPVTSPAPIPAST